MQLHELVVRARQLSLGLVSGYRAAGSIPARGTIVARIKQISDLPTVFDKNTF